MGIGYSAAAIGGGFADGSRPEALAARIDRTNTLLKQLVDKRAGEFA